MEKTASSSGVSTLAPVNIFQCIACTFARSASTTCHHNWYLYICFTHPAILGRVLGNIFRNIFLTGGSDWMREIWCWLDVFISVLAILNDIEGKQLKDELGCGGVRVPDNQEHVDVKDVGECNRQASFYYNLSSFGSCFWLPVFV